MGFGIEDRATLKRWAHANRIPLSPGVKGTRLRGASVLDRMIGDAGIVALGEGSHGISELLEFRNHWFQYLAEERGFSAIAIESGLAESRIVYEYVQGGEGDLRSVIDQGFTWGFEQFPQNRALIEWLRAYNARSAEGRKIKFYGFDLSGSPGLSTSHRGTETALIETLNYLSRIDPQAAATYRSRIAGFLPYFRFDYYAHLEGPNYDRLTPRERDALSAIVSDLITLLEARRHELTKSSSADEYDWAHQAAIGARQIDTWMRQIPHGWEASLAQIDCLDQASDLRDRAQADNIDWIVKRESTQGRVLVFGHNAHLSTSGVSRVWWPCNATQGTPPLVEHRQLPAGIHLKRRYGKDLFTMGHLVGRRRIESNGVKSTDDEDPSSEAIDAVLADTHSPSFLIDLRTTPEPIKQMLDRDAGLGPRFELPGKFQGFLTVRVRQAFDALLFLQALDAS
jgi:erythromycin esterase